MIKIKYIGTGENLISPALGQNSTCPNSEYDEEEIIKTKKIQWNLLYFYDTQIYNSTITYVKIWAACRLLPLNFSFDGVGLPSDFCVFFT